MSLPKLKQKYPDYTEQFLSKNQDILNKTQASFTFFNNITLKQLIQSITSFFALHDYTKNMDQVATDTASNDITCYDDPYARLMYD